LPAALSIALLLLWLLGALVDDPRMGNLQPLFIRLAVEGIN